MVSVALVSALEQPRDLGQVAASGHGIISAGMHQENQVPGVWWKRTANRNSATSSAGIRTTIVGR
jgi:hypothetical protein